MNGFCYLQIGNKGKRRMILKSIQIEVGGDRVDFTDERDI